MIKERRVRSDSPWRLSQGGELIEGTMEHIEKQGCEKNELSHAHGTEVCKLKNCSICCSVCNDGQWEDSWDIYPEAELIPHV
jgi:hypothetical protein